jgi:hypothetical protein
MAVRGAYPGIDSPASFRAAQRCGMRRFVQVTAVAVERRPVRGGVMVEVTVRPLVAAVRGEEGDAALVGQARAARGQLCVPRQRACRPGAG